MFIKFEAGSFLHLTEVILAAKVLVSSLETLAIKDHLKDDGLLSWRIHRLSRPGMLKIYSKTGLDHLFSYPSILILYIIQIAAAISVPFFILLNHSTIIPLAVITAPLYLLILRNYQSDDGSDQMASIMILVLLLAELAGTHFSEESVLVFVAAQASLAYGTSGFLKYKQAKWLDGSYMTDILRTSSYGDRSLLQFVSRHPRSAKYFGLAVVYSDCILAFAFLFPPSLCLILLLFGFIFHLLIAKIMGLNTFLWSFGATFPAIFWVSTSLYRFVT